jgi:thioredoxin 1
MAGLVKEVGYEEYEEEVLKSKLPVFVDFWAEWCGPCLMVAPIIEQLAEEYNGRVKFVKVNVDEGQNGRIADQLGIMGIPTFIIYKDGRPVARAVGAAQKDYYRRMIEEVLAQS